MTNLEQAVLDYENFVITEQQAIAAQKSVQDIASANIATANTTNTALQAAAQATLTKAIAEANAAAAMAIQTAQSDADLVIATETQNVKNATATATHATSDVDASLEKLNAAVVAFRLPTAPAPVVPPDTTPTVVPPADPSGPTGNSDTLPPV